MLKTLELKMAKIGHGTRIDEFDKILHLYRGHVKFYGEEIEKLHKSKEKLHKSKEKLQRSENLRALNRLEDHIQVDYDFVRNLAHNLTRSRETYIENIRKIHEIGSLDD
jgi:hypothetical protein